MILGVSVPCPVPTETTFILIMVASVGTLGIIVGSIWLVDAEDWAVSEQYLIRSDPWPSVILDVSELHSDNAVLQACRMIVCESRSAHSSKIQLHPYRGFQGLGYAASVYLYV